MFYTVIHICLERRNRSSDCILFRKVNGDAEMRIPDYNVPIEVNDLSPKKRRLDKIREEEFGEELVEALH